MGFVRNLTGDHLADNSYITRRFLEERWASLKESCETCNEHVSCHQPEPTGTQRPLSYGQWRIPASYMSD
jgi:hypothetical protein